MNPYSFLDKEGRANWPVLLDEFPFLKQMENCPQEPEWHAEGNVYIHTQMVCDALASLPRFQELPLKDRQILMTAAIFHDCAKPDVTEKIDGRWRSPGHSKQGAQKLRFFWWLNGGAPPVAERELILELVRFHGVPVHWANRKHPESAVIELSQTLRNDLLGLLAEADNLGRRCADEESRQLTILQTQDFVELARQHGCEKTPWPFPNRHARFDHFKRRDGNIHYMAHDDRQFTVTILAGLPGAGKDSWIHQHDQRDAGPISNQRDAGPVSRIVSMDALREEMEIEPQQNQGEVVQAAFELAKTYLRKKEPFIWNATNVTSQMRRKLYDLITDYHGAVRLVWVDADHGKLASRNRKRGKTQVPLAVIERLARKTDFPKCTEAHEFEIVT